MNAQEAQTLQLHEIVVWTPDGTTGEVIVVDGSGVKVRWEDDTIDLPTCCLKSKGYLE